MSELSIYSYLPNVIDYLQKNRSIPVPGWSPGGIFDLQPLGQGEYNMNFLIQQGPTFWVLRVNSGSQIGLPNSENRQGIVR